MRVHGSETTEQVDGQVNVVYSDGTEAIPGLPGRVREVAAQLTRWVTDVRSGTHADGSMFERGKYVASNNPLDQMKVARSAAADDDVVAGALELTEGLAIQGLKWECQDWDATDCFNQMAAEQDLDAVIRAIWREQFSYNQCVMALWWDLGEFKVRGKTSKGNARKKNIKVWYPRRISMLDPAKVIPVGMIAFGQERLAWRATKVEKDAYAAVTRGGVRDELFERFYTGQYVVTDADEAKELTAMKVDTQSLLLLDEQYVRRHAPTKADYARFADVRLRSVFRMLDLKQQLMDADRVALVGAANYILLVKKGDKDDPAYPEEIDNLKENYRTLAKLPVIFSDHRLSVEIITPKQDFTLDEGKYDVLDQRILSRLLTAITQPTSTRSSAGSIQLGRPVAQALQNRRHMIRRFLERELARAVVEHPRNAGLFEHTPSLAFSPPNIHLDSDAGAAQQIISLRTMNELSRESTLEYFGFDQQVEAMRRLIEEERYDDTFQSRVPFSSPGDQGNQDGDGKGGDQGQGAPPADQGRHGSSGGRPTGGGKTSANPAKGPKMTDRGTTSTKE